MKIVLASDHAGFVLKSVLATDLRAGGHEILDLGTDSADVSVNYADYGFRGAHAVADGTAELGVLICGSGIGISIAANRVAGIRCALVHDSLSARLARQHNNANIIAFGERLIGVETARDALRVFLETDFAGGRHQARVQSLG